MVRLQLRAVTDLQRIVRGYFDRRKVAAIRRCVQLCMLLLYRTA